MVCAEKIDYDDGFCRIRLHNKKNSDSSHRYFQAVAYYLQALEQYNNLLAKAIDPNAQLLFEYDGVENASIGLRLKKIIKVEKIRLPSFEEFFGSMSDRGLSKLIEINDEIDTPEKVEEAAEKIEEELQDLAENNGLGEALVDSANLLRVLNLLDKANDCLEGEEYAEIINNSSNVHPINSKFKCKVKPSDLKKYEIHDYCGKDFVKVIKPCNVGNGKWFVESISTKTRYWVSFVSGFTWLEDYQNGKFSSITAKETLEIDVTYKSYKKNADVKIFNAIITKVKVRTDQVSEQHDMF